MKIIHVSDVHLDVNATRLGKLRLSDGKNEVYENRVKIFESVIYAALDAEADLILITGDTFDKNRPFPKEYSDLIRLLDIPSNIQIAIISGNHDELTQKGCAVATIAGRRPGIFVQYETVSTVLNMEFPVILAPWGTKLDDIKESVDRCPDIPVLGFHCSVWNKENKWVELEDESGNVALDDLNKLNCRAILLGHHHGQACLDEGIWYAGSIDAVKDFSEENDTKGFLLWDISKKKTVVQPVSTNPFVSKFKTYDPKEFLDLEEKGFDGFVRVKGEVTDKERLDVVKKLNDFDCIDYKIDLVSKMKANKVFGLTGNSEEDILRNYFKQKDIKNSEELLEINREI